MKNYIHVYKTSNRMVQLTKLLLLIFNCYFKGEGDLTVFFWKIRFMGIKNRQLITLLKTTNMGALEIGLGLISIRVFCF